LQFQFAFTQNLSKTAITTVSVRKAKSWKITVHIQTCVECHRKASKAAAMMLMIMMMEMMIAVNKKGITQAEPTFWWVVGWAWHRLTGCREGLSGVRGSGGIAGTLALS